MTPRSHGTSDNPDYPDAYVAGWESRDGEYHEVYDQHGKLTGDSDEPSNLDLELARNVTIHYENEHGDDIWISVEALTDSYDIDDAIGETWERYA